MKLKRMVSWIKDNSSAKELETKNKLYLSFQAYTMVPREWYIANLEISEKVAGVEGCVVECGVWKGGMIAGIASLLGPQREYWLFDSFEGLPKAKEIDGTSAIDWQNDTASSNYHDNCTAEEASAVEAMRISGAHKSHVIKGWFEESLPRHKNGGPIALLRLDADWYESTMHCLENLYDRVVPGGIIIVDDYYTWDGCAKAVHKFLAERMAPERVHCHNAVAFLVKK